MKRLLGFLLVIMLCLLLLLGCNDNNASKAVERTETQQVQDEVPILESESEPELEPEPEAKQESRGIPGSHYTDVKLGLEQNGFPETALGESKEMDCRTYENVRKDTKNGVDYNCSLFIEKDSTIISAIFGISNEAPVSTEKFLALAKVYIQYCATIPYDTSDVDKVKAWVEENIVSAEEGDKAAKTIIGDAEFALYGTNYPSGVAGSRWIEIKRAF